MNGEQYFIQGLELLFLGIGSYLDIRDRELPVIFLTVFGVLVIFCNVVWNYQGFRNVIIGGMIGATFLLTGWVTKESIGYGDGIGLVILGILEGFPGMIPVIFGAFLFSGIYGLWKLVGLKKSVSDTMPFYPFLLMAFVGVKLL